MPRYIDADKLLNTLPDDLPYKASVKRVLIQAPTADVAEVKHGYWKDNHNGTFACSECGGKASKMDWCGRCGAKMDKKPAVQPDIIMCKDCSYYDITTFNVGYGWCKCLSKATWDDFYCGCAERVE